MKKIFLFLSILVTVAGKTQNDRLRDKNSIAWPQLHLSVAIGKKTDILLEYQWRRTDGFKSWQQSLLRTAIQLRLNDQLSLAAGYGWIETFSYGDFPIAVNGRFPEHRLHEQVQMKTSFKKLLITQRLRAEQRWLARKAAGTERKIEEWLYSNRFRFLLRLQHPVTSSGKIYIAAADEVFIGAGRNVGVNVFDQNRLMFLLGTKLNAHVSMEAGYLSQSLMQARRINNNSILQDNKGIILSANIRL